MGTRHLFVSAASIALTACGGGGGGVRSGGSISPPGGPVGVSPAPTPSPTPAPAYPQPVPPPAGYVITPSTMQPTRSANDSFEFRRNYDANEFSNALYALDSGFTGQGVTVAVIDDGVVNVNGELDGRIDTALSRDFGDDIVGGVRTARDELGDEQSEHGTAVANIIAGNRNGQGAMGYAPDARLAVLRIADWDADTRTETLTHIVEALDYATRQRIKIVNHSLSSGGDPAWSAPVARYGATGGLIVSSAGNSSGSAPADYPAINDSNRNAVLFVGALSPAQTSYQLATYSNRAGEAMDRYVVAVGSNLTTNISGSTATFSGTSSAAPVVSALAATILSKWPQLSGQQAGEIILNTATDIGSPGTDPVFGRGLVDFKAALSPVNPTLSNGVSQSAVASSVMAVPGTMNVTAIQNALSSVTVLDEYGRDFTGSVAGMIIRPEPRQDRWLYRRVEQMGSGGTTAIASGALSASLAFSSVRFGPSEDQVRTSLTTGNVTLNQGQTLIRAAWNARRSMQSDLMGLAPFEDGVMAYAPHAENSIGFERPLAGGRIALTLATGRQDAAQASAATLGWSVRGTELRAGIIDERGSIMGTPTGHGALRLGLGATTMMMEAHHMVALGHRWSLEGYGSLGITRLKIDGASLVTDATPILGSRLGLQVRGRIPGGMLSVGIAQPLTIESGAARLTYASGYDLVTRSLTYTSTLAGLADRRRLRLTAGFGAGGSRSSLRIGLMHDMSEQALSALAGWFAAF
ncbi:S8 family serine peptidase [Sphingomonas sp. IW22]